MFGRRNISGIWKPKNPHSLEYLKYLHGVLTKNSIVTEHNRGLLVEALRAIAEILIWGDQNDPSVFDFFLEKNILGFFLRIMKQKCGRYVCTQLLQTLNILFENISNETSLYYLLSNNHVNSIITHRFDFSDEEILAYYISFLKTLSLKLNTNTVHFFFNEHTNDFPLYTEAIKFFNHSESMVRIAVRTLTLNVYRVNDLAMLAFIRDNAAAPYFANFVFFIVKHVVDIDSCVAAGDSNSLQVRDKLSDYVAEHLDHIHYMNDVMRLNIDSLNAVLRDQFLKKLLVPVYLGSLSPEFQFEGSARVSPPVALFLLSQVFVVLTHAPLVERLANLLFLGDYSSLSNEGPTIGATSGGWTTSVKGAFEGNKTDDEKLKTRCPSAGTSSAAANSLNDRPLLLAMLNYLDCDSSDHAAFFALCLLHSMCQNSGVPIDLLRCSPSPSESNGTCELLLEVVKRLLGIVAQGVQHGECCKVRIITMEACSTTLKFLLARSTNDGCKLIKDHVLSKLRSLHETMVCRLRHHAQSETMFLDLFEDEYRQAQARNCSISSLSSDATLLLPPSRTPLSGIDFPKRLPCGPQEHARHGIGVFLIIRRLLNSVVGDEDDFQRAFSTSPSVAVGDCLNLTNSDLLACTVVTNDGIRCQRFLVTGGLQLMLVEPDASKLGYGVVRFAGFLQDCQVAGDKDDSRTLNVTMVAPSASPGAKCPPPHNVKMIFDDHIRCMAAKQRLTKGRQKAREYKMGLISRLLQLGASDYCTEDTLPSPLLSQPADRRVPGFVAVSAAGRDKKGDCTVAASRSGDTAADPQQRRLACSSTKRRVRVLSAESVAPGGVQHNAVGGRIDEGVGEKAAAKTELNYASALSEAVESCSFIAKRSNSLSPRVVPRFGVPSEGVEQCSSLAQSAGGGEQTAAEEGIEMKTVRCGDDATPSSTSLQCFVGKRKTFSQVLDI